MKFVFKAAIVAVAVFGIGGNAHAAIAKGSNASGASGELFFVIGDFETQVAAVVDLGVTVFDFFNDGVNPGIALGTTLFTGDANVQAVINQASSLNNVRWSVAGFDEVNFSVNPLDSSDWIGMFASTSDQNAFLAGGVAGTQSKANFAIQAIDADNGEGANPDTAANLSSLHDPAAGAGFTYADWFPDIDGAFDGKTLALLLSDDDFVQMYQISIDADGLPFTPDPGTEVFSGAGFRFDENTASLEFGPAPAVIPLPAAAWMFVPAIAGLFAAGRRRAA